MKLQLRKPEEPEVKSERYPTRVSAACDENEHGEAFRLSAARALADQGTMIGSSENMYGTRRLSRVSEEPAELTGEEQLVDRISGVDRQLSVGNLRAELSGNAKYDKLRKKAEAAFAGDEMTSPQLRKRLGEIDELEAAEADEADEFDESALEEDDELEEDENLEEAEEDDAAASPGPAIPARRKRVPVSQKAVRAERAFREGGYPVKIRVASHINCGVAPEQAVRLVRARLMQVDDGS
jgi:hypothetical protein